MACAVFVSYYPRQYAVLAGGGGSVVRDYGFDWDAAGTDIASGAS